MQTSRRPWSGAGADRASRWTIVDVASTSEPLGSGRRCLALSGAVMPLLMLAVIGPSADRILAAPVTVLQSAVLSLAVAARPLLPRRGERIAMQFTVSTKGLSIAALVVFASGLPAGVALPTAVSAVVQVITSPVIATAVARGGQGRRRG